MMGGAYMIPCQLGTTGMVMFKKWGRNNGKLSMWIMSKPRGSVLATASMAGRSHF